MSVREQSFTKALFHGVVAEDLIHPFPSLSQEERDAVALLEARIRDGLSRHVDSAAIDATSELPAALLAATAELGLFGLTVERAYGGLGLSSSAAASVLAALGELDASLAVVVATHNALGAWAIQAYGNEEQKRRLLPDVASGRRLVSFALTERNAGSDGSAIEATATFAEDGAGYVLEGEKLWITNATRADVFVAFARTDQERGHPRITAFLVERGPGVDVAAPTPLVGTRAIGAATVRFDRVRVPFRNVLGEVGKGYALGLGTLNWGRVALSSTALGGSRRLLTESTERALQRRAFRQPIAEFGQTKDRIARMACEIWAVESGIRLTTGLMDAKVEDVILESAMVKIAASEAFVRHADEAMRLGAGSAFERGSGFERAARDARAHLVLAGTNEILTAYVALAGMESPSKKLAEVGQAMRDPIKGLGMLTDFAVRRARTTFGRERLTNVHPALRAESVTFEDGVAGLARETERVLRKHGKNLATRQFVQRRIAEVATDLFLLVAVVGRAGSAADRKGESQAQTELELTYGVSRLLGPRLRDRLSEMERDTDELLKQIAARTYQARGRLPDPPR